MTNETFLTLLCSHAPETKKLVPDHPDTAWYNAYVGEAKKAGHCAERRFRNKQLFRQAHDKCNLTLVKKTKTDHKCELKAASSDPCKMFSVLNNLHGKDASPSIFPDLAD